MASQWLSDASRHLEAARAIAELDPSGAYVFAYDAARKSIAAALLRAGHFVRTLNEVVTTAQPMIEKNGNEFVEDYGDDLGEVHADLTKVRQCLFNLISNAAKLTTGGSITLTARRISKDGEPWISMAVTDTGIGIPEDKLDLVFKEFAQVDDSTTRDFGGTGLGLALTRQICGMMGGEISLESEFGVGSTFTITLPASVSESEDDGLGEPANNKV